MPPLSEQIPKGTILSTQIIARHLSRQMNYKTAGEQVRAIWAGLQQIPCTASLGTPAKVELDKTSLKSFTSSSCVDGPLHG